jgi:hypothetical protein
VTTASTLAPSSGPTRPPTLEQHLVEARHRVQVSDDELMEARRRRRILSDALLEEFRSGTSINGSIAHGDALTPLADVDLGVIVAEAQDSHGPAGKAARTSRSAQPRRSELL